jgi:hypothetical protein
MQLNRAMEIANEATETNEHDRTPEQAALAVIADQLLARNGLINGALGLPVDGLFITKNSARYSVWKRQAQEAVSMESVTGNDED